MAINNATYPPIDAYLSRKEHTNVAACKSYVYKYEKPILEWEHDDYTQVEINDIIEEVLWTTIG
jgi:hypothetical protein